MFKPLDAPTFNGLSKLKKKVTKRTWIKKTRKLISVKNVKYPWFSQQNIKVNKTNTSFRQAL